VALLSSGLRITAVTALALAAATDARPQVEPVSLSTLTQFTFPSGLVAARSGQRFAWTLMQRGERSLWVADGPAFAPHRLVQYPDDGQELTNLVFSHDGAYLIYVRGGNHAANGPAPGNLMPNPTSSPRQPSMQVWSVPVAGGAPILLGDGDEPAASPADLRVAFRRGREIWWAPADGSKPAARLFFARGSSESPAWSPDGRMLAFASNRGDYGYIAIYSGDDQPIRYIAPTTWQDSVPRWSPDGSRIAFVRRRSAGGSWSIWIGDAASGDARQLWQSPSGPRRADPPPRGG
jgi:dipeptidyl aminopeptidase/acylaminoacyl peptidase